MVDYLEKSRWTPETQPAPRDLNWAVTTQLLQGTDVQGNVENSKTRHVSKLKEKKGTKVRECKELDSKHCTQRKETGEGVAGRRISSD